MSEPLAATLLCRRGAGDALGRATGRSRARRWLAAGRAARRAGDGPARVPGGRRPARARRLRPPGAAADWRRGRSPRRRSCSPGVAVVVAPWTIRNAVALDRFVPISTGGGQVLFAGTYLPSDGDPERVGAEVRRRAIPELFDPPTPERLRLEQILAAARRQRYPELETDQALSRMGREQLWDDISEEPLEYAGFVADQDRPDLVARPARRDARAGLGGAALGAASASACSASACSPGGAAGRRWSWRRSSSRSPRSAPCSSPRRGGCW